MSDAEQLILKEQRGATGLIRLNRPKKHNALSLGLLKAVGEEVGRLTADQNTRAIIITGSEKAFSTGADLDEALNATTYQDALNYSASFRALGQILEKTPKAVIAAINGFCITGGLELALMCDIRLAAPNATFGITSAKIGSVAGAGGTQRVTRAVGAARAKELLMTCEYIDAKEADRIGLINRVVHDKPVLDAAIEMAEKISRSAPLSVGWAKSAVDVGVNVDLQSGLTYEAHLIASAFMTEDRTEGMKSFLEKRAPVFKGR